MKGLLTASRMALCSEVAEDLRKKMEGAKTFADKAEAAKVLHKVLLDGFDAALKCDDPRYSDYFHKAATTIELAALKGGFSLK